MKMGYIRETEEINGFFKKLNFIKNRIFNIINLEKNENKDIYYLPIDKNTKISKYEVKRILKKLIKILEKNGIYNVAISKYLDNINNFKTYLYSQNINILDGKYLFKCLVYDILIYIFNKRNKHIELGEVTLLVNDFDKITTDLIILIAKNIKRINIVTNHMQKCKKIEKYLYNEFGIILNTSNNKKTSLSKSEIIVNIDFPEESLNKYNLYDRAIILNILGKIYIKSKRFNGINVNYYKIQIPLTYELKGFENEIIYESLIYNFTNLETIREKIVKDKIQIKTLVGSNGFIDEKEINKI